MYIKNPLLCQYLADRRPATPLRAEPESWTEVSVVPTRRRQHEGSRRVVMVSPVLGFLAATTRAVEGAGVTLEHVYDC